MAAPLRPWPPSRHDCLLRPLIPFHSRKTPMKHSCTLRWLGLAGIGSLLAGSALAQQDGYYYGGIGVGQTQSQIDEPTTAASLLPPGVGITSLSRDDRVTAYKLFGGYQFTPNFALEGGYFNLGKIGFQSTTTGGGTLNGQYEIEGLNLDLVGTAPLDAGWSLFGRLGAQYANTRSSFNGTGIPSDTGPSERQTNLKVGLGVQYEFSPSVILRGEAERYRVRDGMGSLGDVNVFSLALVFPFGRTPMRTQYAASPPAYVAPAAPAPAPAEIVEVTPPPIVVIETPAPAPKRVQLSADSLFGFNQSSVSPEGRMALDALLQDLQGTQFDVVLVEGHTDRLGSAAYNQKLSQQRAQAVKDYLVSSGGLDAAKVTAVGKGASNPVTQPGDCKGKKASPALIACLQPDRRVDVEVSGMR